MKIVSKNVLHAVAFATVVCGGTVQADWLPRFGELNSLRGKLITSFVVQTADEVIPEDGYKNEKYAFLDGLGYGVEGLVSEAKPEKGADLTKTFSNPTSVGTCVTKALIVGSLSYGVRIAVDKYGPSREAAIEKCNALTDNKIAQKVMSAAVNVVAKVFAKPVTPVNTMLLVVERLRTR